MRAANAWTLDLPIDMQQAEVCNRERVIAKYWRSRRVTHGELWGIVCLKFMVDYLTK
jgi:hypothetical protein